MIISDIVEFWAQQSAADPKGRWMHPLDAVALSSRKHSFNLDYPVSPFVGHIVSAKVFILGANAGYSPSLTPTEFPSPLAVTEYVRRVQDPENSDWSFVSKYYGKVNYGKLILDGDAALINACAYRSPKISEEPENRRLIEQLPSVLFTRQWLREAVLPLASQGTRLVVAKRAGLWKLSGVDKANAGVAADPAPVSPQITSTAWLAVQKFLTH